MTYDEEHALAQVAQEAITELRRRRRWKIFFRLIWLLIFIAIAVRLFVPNKGEDASPFANAHVAVVEIDGVISAGMEANAEDINEVLDRAFAAVDAKAVVLDINSPGGSPVQSGQVYRHIQALKADNDKPLYAVINDVGASGAYYIAAVADEIYADPASIVGSIGVISQSIGVQDLLDNIGVESRTFTSGEHKDFLSPAAPLKSDEVAHMNQVLNDVHQQFIDAVEAGRGDRLVDPESNQLFSGLFWSGAQAEELGLVDGLASLRELVDERYGQEMPVVVYSPDLTPWQQLTRDLKSSVTQQINTLFGKGEQINAVLTK
ncbi:signal peptide peptidase SppA [Suttonella sp. R2A3]|uniref:signal peptide peptidase SppA n=1 Tax=Suttonella sp. R2A3 TaxID=2908648 RepID=UPI001F46960C|nr:signal peptide peptidase SppA [Suttonella sp. R2A3]UJF24888.1 signal peptide peptidase SppA [Suttonella sp. R2A3]